MIKRIIAVLLTASMLITLSACYNYIGLNEMSIVMGFAIDKEDDNYLLSFEIIDMKTSSKDTGIKTLILEARGKTIFDAIRNAKRRTANKLYFANIEAIIISKEVAQEGLYSVIDWFYRDEECRESVEIIISEEEYAKNLYVNEGIITNIVSHEIGHIIMGDMHSTGLIQQRFLYQIYNILKRPGISLNLPAFNLVKNDGKDIIELSGVAVFKEDKLSGFLDAEKSKILMFVLNEKKGGIFTLNTDWGKQENISLELTDNKTKKSYTYENNKLKIKIETNTSAFIGEDRGNLVEFEKEDILQVQQKFKEKLQKNIKDLIHYVQLIYGSDIFGFGNLIYQKEPTLWRELESNWDTIFKNLEVEVTSELKIQNTAYIR